MMKPIDEVRQKLALVGDPAGLLEGFFALSPFGLQIYRADGRCLLVNPAFRALFGSEPPPEYSVLEDDVARERGVLQLIQRAFQGEVVTVPPTWYDPRELKQVKVTEGRRVAITATFFPLFDHAGAVTHVGIVFDDVTAEHAALERAERMNRRSELLARASSVFVESLDPDITAQRISEVTVPQFADWCTVSLIGQSGLRRVAVAHKDPARAPAAQEYLKGFPPDRHGRVDVVQTAITGVPMLLQFDPNVLRQFAQSERHRELLEELGTHSVMLVPLKARGSLLGVVSFMRGPESPAYTDEDLATAGEISARASLALDNARLFAAEKQARASLEEALKARDEFISVASHELKTPLTSLRLQISGLLRVIRTGRATDAESLLTRVEKTDVHALRITSLVEQLLDVTRLTAGRLVLQREPVDLAALVTDVLSRFEEVASVSGCALSVSGQELSLIGQWDRSRLDQVFTNLVANALKFGNGQPVEVALSEAAGRACVEVRDHGIGIDARDQGRVFERFERAASARHFGGMGLGLWIVRHIVELHGGTVSVSSVPGQGSTFRVELPVGSAG